MRGGRLAFLPAVARAVAAFGAAAALLLSAIPGGPGEARAARRRPAARPGRKPATHSFAPEAVPAIKLIPAAAPLGGTAAIEVQVEMPRRAGAPSLVALAGGSVTKPALVDGLWIAKYRPPKKRAAPGYDILLARTPSGAVGIAVVRWIAHAKLPVTVTRAGAKITVTVAGVDYGPVDAGANSTVPVEVELPPGAREVTVTAAAPGVEPLHTTEPLALPPLERVFIDAPPSLSSAKEFQATVVVLDRDGHPSRKAPSLTVTNARVREQTEVGPGVWLAAVTPDGGGTVAMIVRGEHARGRATVRVRGRPAVAAATPPPAETAAPSPAATPLPREPMPAVARIPPAPDCTQLAATPGEMTTAAELRRRIHAAMDVDDLVARRDALIALGCRFPDEHVIQLQLAATDLLLGDHAGTIAVVDPLLADENEIHDEHLALGFSYRAAAELRMGKLEAAVADAKTSETHMPGLYSATYTLGEAEFLRAHFEEAMAALLSAYRTAPQFASPIDHEMLAELLEKKGDLAEALEHRVAMARADANDLDGWRHVARAAEQAKQWARAQEAWLIVAAATIPGLAENREAMDGAARAKAEDPKSLEMGFLDAALKASTGGNRTKATFLLEKTLAAAPDNLAARYHLARELAAQGAVARAGIEISQVLNDAPHWAPALILSGDVERLRGDKPHAEARYREALALEPPTALSAVARWRLGELTAADAH